MESSNKKFFATFDKFLFGSLGCAMLVLCVLLGVFVYVWQNPPGSEPVVTQTSLTAGAEPTLTSDPTATALFPFVTPTEFLALMPTQAGELSGIPSPIPEFGNSVPTGKIVFTCFINEIDQICIMNADGSGRKQLTEFDGTAFYASLAPDGNRIYFSSRDTGNYEIYVMNIRGRELRRLTGGIGSLYAPERSPTDDRIVFTNQTGGKQQIWVMRTDGKNPHPITEGPEDIDPTYSPNGMLIAFASARTGQRQLYVMERDGSDVRQVTDLPDMGGRSSWSPDGRRLTFYAGPVGDRNIYVINVDGTGLVQLTHGGDNLGPSWSPDGEWIAFTSYRDGNNEIYIMHPDGTGATRMTANAIPDWQPRWGP